MYINYLPNQIKINRLGLSCILESRFGVNVLGAALKISMLKGGLWRGEGAMWGTWAVVCRSGAARLVDADIVKSDLDQRQVM